MRGTIADPWTQDDDPLTYARRGDFYIQDDETWFVALADGATGAQQFPDGIWHPIEDPTDMSPDAGCNLEAYDVEVDIDDLLSPYDDMEPEPDLGIHSTRQRTIREHVLVVEFDPESGEARVPTHIQGEDGQLRPVPIWDKKLSKAAAIVFHVPGPGFEDIL
jgi:hypothetical protein